MEREQQKASLNSPLIQNIEQDGSIVDVEKSKSSAIGRSEFLEEVRRQLWLAGPLIIVNLLNYSLQVISVMFVGHLGELALSGTSIASSFASVTGFTFLVSLVFLTFPFTIYVILKFNFKFLDSQFWLISES
ncbi:putative multi antimicrobial extrusion protein [Lupinus albus]|uniref:Putative multi antimicrobial extrusion protein n=1 Tax=Lupinus albus TaxID=3870 RepID=A0A6A4NYT8_LUPAL|nr:putative multi antimicrobial extrusion protein [Lupinus albus]